MAYTKADLKHDLAAMGLTGAETILIHSSMKSIGAVEGSADTVLDALMEFFAEGLLLLPTHTWRFINEVDLLSAGGYSGYGKVLLFDPAHPHGLCLAW